ncbi:phospholipid transport system substrate-binding protein [Nitrosospira multiformis ATCC 25196]|uniref:Phospholipid transport system substrate-binding protein n=2 Tax=Nitrosospira multiformis TaxID=1231 RepID=Q2Y5X3_NITMU|nr:Toluene tolerance [Nitrosospira multiformis ATCC 25196]SEF65069.1 phospholipid transport system substrate-binding protein [Nitrosospira multiformis ATCC 25196]
MRCLIKSCAWTNCYKIINMKILSALKSLLQLQIIVLMLLAASPSWSETQESGTPEQVVKQLQEALIKAMREGAKLGYEGRYELLAPVINQTHDLDFIARTSLGANWTQLSAEQQRTFTDTFRKLSIATYASQFKEYDGERFESLERQSMPREQVMIRSKLIQSGGEPVRFDYMLRQGKDGWRIVNILADGVSDLALKRVEYRAILQRDGFPKLLDMLQQKIEQAGKD